MLIELLRLVGEWSDAFYRDVGLGTISNEPVGFFAETEPSPYWQVIAREYVERFTHQSQIRRAVGAAELDREIVAAAARVEVHVLAAWMRDYAPAVGSAIALDLGAVGAWTWQRGPDRWEVFEGAVSPATRISVPPAATVAMLSRGVTADDAATNLVVDGDETLARGAIDIIMPLLGRPA